MADLKYRTAAQTQTGTRAEIDEGLRSYMLGVYNYMALGVAFTAVVSLYVASNQALLQAAYSGRWILFIAVLGLGWFSPRLMFGKSVAVAHAAYWVYAGVWGLAIAPWIAVYMGLDGGQLIVRALGITAITFGSMSLLGYVTKKDLGGIGSFAAMSTIGLVIAIIVNAIFFQSTLFSFATSAFVVLAFSAITAWETQIIKQMYVAGETGTTAKQKSIFGAFMLYGSFVTMFIHILNMLGIMSGD
ncbi:MAG: Bax inhibitor-1/YccA family protein [Hyphomicrobiales bacterium]|nr:Bax inhibitor-1/YccA family protein [Hyphomicrobiales bacterium]